MKKVALVSLGCAKNLVDSEVMLGFLAQHQYHFVSDINQADIIIVNTCGFIHPARNESESTIKNAIEAKEKAKTKRIIVTGCYVERSKPALRHLFPEVDVWLGLGDFDKIIPAVEQRPFEHTTGCFLYDHTSPRLRSTPPGWSYVKISEGCSHQCSFCAIPLIKGSYQSRRIASITKEARNLAAAGVKEINLISQDSTSYGMDLGKTNGLVLLLKELLNIKKLKWIRILYSHPEKINEPLLDIMGEEKICSYLDIPLQHSHPHILKRMKRKGDSQKALKWLETVRKKIPDIAIRTSLVVGFPGEGKREFENLKDFVQQARFDHLGVFTYSPEKGTSGYHWGDPVKENVKRKRKERIMDIQADISYQNNQKYVNKIIDVLVEGTLKKDSSVMVGRGKFQAPEVDGVIFLSHPQSSAHVFNTLQKVEITQRDVYDLYGNLLP